MHIPILPLVKSPETSLRHLSSTGFLQQLSSPFKSHGDRIGRHVSFGTAHSTTI